MYWSQHLHATLDLDEGPVALILPFRGIVQTQIQCTIKEPTTRNIELELPLLVPSLLQLPKIFGGKTGYGVFLSNLLSVVVRNLKSQVITVTFALESSKLIDGM